MTDNFKLNVVRMNNIANHLPLFRMAARCMALSALAIAADPSRLFAEPPAELSASPRLDALQDDGDYHAMMKKLAIADRPDLPQLFFCGDSISQHNAPWVKVALIDKVDVTHWLDLPTRYPRIVPKTPYSGTSELLIEMLDTVLISNEYHPKFLVLNAGLHDATFDVPVEQYRTNLVKVVELARKHRTKMVWMLTTPRTQGHTHNPKIDAYNVAAREVMKQYDVPVIDLHSFAVDVVARHGEQATYNGDDVHYASPVRKQMGTFLGKELTRIFNEDLTAAKRDEDAKNECPPSIDDLSNINE